MAGESGPGPLEILESHHRERPGFGRRWRAQGARERSAQTGLALCVLVSACLGWYLTRPLPKPPTPTQWPALLSSVAYEGTGHGFSFVVSAFDHDVAPVTITHMTFSSPGLTLRTDPPLPIELQPGQSRRIQLIATATDCSAIPRSDALPFIDVTFRNIRAIGQISEILGDRYTHDLNLAVTAACRRT